VVAPRLTVLGAGAWGTALSIVAADAGNLVSLYGRDKAQMSALKAEGVNAKYLPQVVLPDNIQAIDDWRSSKQHLGLVLVAVPYQHARTLLREIHAADFKCDGVIWASKGIEQETHALAHEIVADELGRDIPFAMVSGPNFAIEVANRQPAAVTVAGVNEKFVAQVCKVFHTEYFRPYSTNDVVGVEVGGAVKNVIAIAAGISDGLNLGANARAALVTRGLAEIARWGICCGGRAETFMGLSGLGDLVLTCTDDLSRNRRFGLHLAAGMTLTEAIDEVGLVEGAKTSVALAEVAKESTIDMPISSQVAAIVAGGVSPKEAVISLMARDLSAEFSS